MHAQCEAELKGESLGVECPEMRLFRKWRAEFQPDMNWTPARMEWKLWYDDKHGRLLFAGTIDLLLYSAATDEYALVDYKRIDPKPKYAGGRPHYLSPCYSARYHPGFGKQPLDEVEATQFGEYTVQLNLYAKILRDCYGVDVGHHMYLVQMHEDMDTFHAVRVEQHICAVDALVAAEAERPSPLQG